MMRHPAVCVFLLVAGGLSVAPRLATGQVLLPQTPQASGPASPSTSGLEAALLRSLLANPATAPYSFSTERRGSKIALRGRVGTKQIHDVAIQTAIALGVPVIDDLVIDTLAAHQAAVLQSQQAIGPMGAGGYAGVGGYAGAGPSSGLGGPGAGVAGSLPYTYPPPLFGRLDDPFFGFQPPAIAYPPWWGALTARRLGLQAYPMGPGAIANNPPENNQALPSQAVPQADPADAQATNLPSGTIDMAIDGRGVATLRGTVPTLTDRIAIGQKVAQTPGVSQVINLLNVRPLAAAPTNAINPSDKPPPPPVPADLTPMPPKAPALAPAVQIEPATGAADSDPVGQRASKAIASRAPLAGQTIRVKVRDGVASLSGKVPTVYEAMLAFRAVQQTPGVRGIEDRLEFVVPDGSAPNPLADKGRPEDVEPYLEAQIRRQVGDLAHVDRVRVQGDSLVLRGTLEREEDRDRFDAIIRSMPILRGFRITAEMPTDPR